MTEIGRENAKRAVDSLYASGSTNVVDGLKKGVQVLEERRFKNPVSSIVFLSDGQDNCNSSGSYSWQSHTSSYEHQPPNYIKLLPSSICPGNKKTETEGQQEETFPVHAFGFGTDHDPITMHAISDSSGGTFSFIESYEMVQDAFASCVGGLLSVTTQELQVIVKSATNGVDIKSIPSGRYVSEISNEGSQGTINVNDLYADEEKEFLVYVSVPILGDQSEPTTSLLEITCSYRDAISKNMVQIKCDIIEIRRPEIPSPSDMKVNLKVDRQRNRLNAAKSIVEAQMMAETGNFDDARGLLFAARSSIFASAAGQEYDDLSMSLGDEMIETGERMKSRQSYERSGRAYAFAFRSSHDKQRATCRSRLNKTATEGPSMDVYMTKSMADMVQKSQQQLNKTTIEGSYSPKKFSSHETPIPNPTLNPYVEKESEQDSSKTDK